MNKLVELSTRDMIHILGIFGKPARLRVDDVKIKRATRRGLRVLLGRVAKNIAGHE